MDLGLVVAPLRVWRHLDVHVRQAIVQFFECTGR